MQQFTNCGVQKRRLCLQVSMGGSVWGHACQELLPSNQGVCSSGPTHAVWAQGDSTWVYLLRKDQKIGLWAPQVQASSKPGLIFAHNQPLQWPKLRKDQVQPVLHRPKGLDGLADDC